MMTPPLSFSPKFGEMGDGTTTIARTKRGGDALSVLTHNGAEESNDPLFYFVKRSKCVVLSFSVVVGRDCAKRTVVEIVHFFKCPVRW